MRAPIILITLLANHLSLMFVCHSYIGRVQQTQVQSILDPRFKKLHFNNHIAYSQAINKIARQMESLNNESKKENLSGKENVSTENTSLSNDIWSFHEDPANKTQFLHDKSDEIPTDLKHYLNEPVIALNEDPMNYWFNKSIYPYLRMIAKQYLSIVATSVPSERLFSKAGIITENRNRVSSKHLQNLLFLNSLSLNEWKINDN